MKSKIPLECVIIYRRTESSVGQASTQSEGLGVTPDLDLLVMKTLQGGKSRLILV